MFFIEVEGEACLLAGSDGGLGFLIVEAEGSSDERVLFLS